MPKSIYNIIKKQNGETFAKAIRKYDDTIFDISNLPNILKYAGRNPIPLLRFLHSLRTEEKSLYADISDPFVLLKRAGYTAFYADTLEKQNSIRSYFTEDEALCTFTDSNRFKNYYIVHAIKENAHILNRTDFNNKESREDAYGISVISIQMLKLGGFIKITNRYNHTVPSCDNTFNSNPDNIIPGLTNALKNYFEVDFSVKQVPIPDNFLYQNGCLYHYNQEINNCFIGNDFYCKDGIVYPIDKNSQIVADEFIIDLKEKKILNPANSTSSLYKVLQEETKGLVWQIQKRENRHVLFVDNKEILSLENGAIRTLYLRKTNEVESFLSHHKYIEELHGYSITKLGKKSLSHCPNLRYSHLPRCEEIGENCLEKTSAEIEAPILKKQGIYFISGVGIDIRNNTFVSQGSLPYPLYDFLKRNMYTVSLLDIKETNGENIVYANKEPFLRFRDNKLIGLHFPEGIQVIETAVLMDVPYLKEVSGQGVYMIEDANLLRCYHLQKANFPHVKYIGCNCIVHCDSVEELSFPELVKIPSCTSLCCNRNLRYVYAPKLFIIPELSQLPSLERFDSERGIHLRQTPTLISSNSYPRKFIFIEKSENEKR
ncbi:MAG: hypothetical protein IJO11_06620 [Alphaproteobacteria bacterium]|nr:hypothetical protein [Alphaproteobacteria bacterium]